MSVQIHTHSVRSRRPLSMCGSQYMRLLVLNITIAIPMSNKIGEHICGEHDDTIIRIIIQST